MKDYFLEITGACKSFDAVKALDNVDFSVEKGEVHCLIGQNGCGKSTLIKIISGVYKCEGNYTFKINNEPVTHYSTRMAMDKGIQVIYQDLSLFPQMTVAENIAYIVSQQNPGIFVKRKDQREIAKKAMEMMNIDIPIDEKVENLSIAKRQLVAMCRALATDARLLIMDEPTSSLTKREIRVLFGIIEQLNKQGISMIFVSHKLDEIFEIADRVTVLRDGKKIDTIEKENLDIGKLEYYISGQTTRYQKPIDIKENTTVLSVKNLKREGEFHDISFHLKKGEVLGLIGLLGSGRTELALSLFGMHPAESGTIEIEGESVKLKTVEQAIDKGIAYLPEDRLLQGGVLDQDLEMNTTITILKKLAGRFGIIDKKKSQDKTAYWIEKLNTKCNGVDSKFRTLSGGNQQKVVLAKWLVTAPKVLILDEPTNGVDIAAKGAIYDVIRNLTEDGYSVILISSEVPEIYHNCHRIAVMKKGTIAGIYNTDEVTEKEVEELAISE